jgi:putative oxidoreductase
LLKLSITMTSTHTVMHHDPGAAALAIATYEAEQRINHEAKRNRQVQYYAAGRIFLATLFITSAVAKMVTYRDTVRALSDSLTDANMLLPFAVAIELIGGLFLAVGYKARPIAIGLISYLATVTLLLNSNLSNPLNRSMALANFAFAGALLMIVGHGGGALSVDHYLEHRRK